MKLSMEVFDEIEVTAWLLVAALVAFILMLGHTLWKSIAADSRETTLGPSR